MPTNADALTPDEQAILLWMAESEASVNEPLAVSLIDFASERVSSTVARLVRAGFVSRASPLLSWGAACLDSLCAELTPPGVQVVAELLRRRFRQARAEPAEDAPRCIA